MKIRTTSCVEQDLEPVQLNRQSMGNENYARSGQSKAQAALVMKQNAHRKNIMN